MPQKQTLAQFGQTVKAKHPEYNDLPDEVVGQRVLAKYPQYADMVESSPAADPSLLANPQRQGTYQMASASGPVSVPYGNVARAQQQGYTLSGDDAARYQKDSSADPAQKGAVRSFFDATGIPTLAQTAAQVAMHPVDSARNVVNAMSPTPDPANPIVRAGNAMVDNTLQGVKRGIADYKATGFSQQTRRDFGGAVPLVGPALKQAQAQSDAGNNSGAVGTLLGTAAGFAAPELAKVAPLAGARVAEATGDALEGAGAARMDRFINGGKKLPAGEYGNPGRAVLESGPSTSFAKNRPQLTRQIAGAKSAQAPMIDVAAAASPNRVPVSAVRDAVDSTIDPMRSAATGPGSAQPNLPSRLDALRDTFEPGISQPGDMSATDALDLRRQLDKSIAWNSGPSSIDLTLKNAQRAIRGKVNQAIYDNVPELQQPSARYGDLADAQELSEKNQNIPTVKWGGVKQLVTDAALGLGVGSFGHSAEAAGLGIAGAELAPALWKLPAVQTGLATGMYQAGRAANAVAPSLAAVAPLVDRTLSAAPTFASQGVAPLAANASLTATGDDEQNQKSNSEQNVYSTEQHSKQSTPPGGASSVRPSLTSVQPLGAATNPAPSATYGDFNMPAPTKAAQPTPAVPAKPVAQVMQMPGPDATPEQLETYLRYGAVPANVQTQQPAPTIDPNASIADQIAYLRGDGAQQKPARPGVKTTANSYGRYSPEGVGA